MQRLCFSCDLQQNIKALQDVFAGDNTFVCRMAESRGTPRLRCAVFFFDGMVSNLAINQSVVRPITDWKGERLPCAEALAHSILQVNDSRVETDADKMLASFLYGDTVVFVEGDARPVVVNTKGFSLRSASEPDSERVLQGPREGFTEGFMTNLSMLRRRLRSPRLKLKFLSVGFRTQTTVCLCYLDDLCDSGLVASVEKRLAEIPLDGVLDANYLLEYFQRRPASPFPTVGTTERPDVVTARLLEGRCALIVDGTPVALTLPYVLQECFQANDDYYLPFLEAGLARALRYLGFAVAVLTPGVYLAVLLYHAELLPTRLLLAVGQARRGMPLPVLPETILLLLVFELLKQAGARTPGLIGQTVSIVGGLVLGQAAVSARFVSAPGVIVVALSAIAGLAAPKLRTAVLTLRFGILLGAAVFGMYGVLLGASLTVWQLCTLSSCGIPYTLNLLPRVRAENEDAFLRVPWFRMRVADRFLNRRKRP